VVGFTYTIVASSLHDRDAVDRITAPVRTRLDALGGRSAPDPAAVVDAPHLVVVATGGTEQQVLATAARRRSAVPWEPVVLVAHPLHNSLPASLESLARLHRDGTAGLIVQLDASGTEALADAVADLVALHRLRRIRLGLVGEPSEWLVASVPDRSRLAQRWGIELVGVAVEPIVAGYRAAADDAGLAVAVRFSGRDHPAATTLAAAAVHPVLVRAAVEAGVDAVAVRCFDFLTELETSGCLALAELNDAGVVAGCEGDVAATVAMLVARIVLDRPAWVANPASIDPAANQLLLAHCTVAPSMVDDVELHTHFESGIGIGIRGTFAPGPVTLIRLGGEALDEHWFAEADVVASGDSPDLCRTQVTLRVRDRPVRELLEAPLGNHLVMVQGHHRNHLERWWSLAFGGELTPA
jgi:L-fucose isomerase-like protein